MLAEGKYRAVAMPGASASETKSGKAYVAVDFRVTQGEMQGETIEWRGWLTSDKSAQRTMQSLRSCGWKGTDITDLGELDQEVQIVVEHEEYEGKTRAKVAWVNAPRRQLETGAAAALRDRMKALAAAVPLVDGAPPSQEPSDDPFA